jgi:uncharacterized protein YqgQ
VRLRPLLILLLLAVSAGCHQNGGRVASTKPSPEELLCRVRDQIGQVAIDIKTLHEYGMIREEQYLKARKDVEKAADVFNKVKAAYVTYKVFNESDLNQIFDILLDAKNALKGEELLREGGGE